MRTGRLQLLLVLAIAIGTPIASTLLYFYAPPSGTTNYGELVTPSPLPEGFLDEQDGDNNWRMLVLGKPGCGPGCKERLCVMRQVRLVRIGDVLRIDRLWLVDGGGQTPTELEMAPSCGRDVAAAATAKQPVDILSGVVVHRTTPALLDALPEPAQGSELSGYIYLVDPSGSVMMRYPEDAAVKDLAKDLGRLLRLSRKAG